MRVRKSCTYMAKKKRIYHPLWKCHGDVTEEGHNIVWTVEQRGFTFRENLQCSRGEEGIFCSGHSLFFMGSNYRRFCCNSALKSG